MGPKPKKRSHVNVAGKDNIVGRGKRTVLGFVVVRGKQTLGGGTERARRGHFGEYLRLRVWQKWRTVLFSFSGEWERRVQRDEGL